MNTALKYDHDLQLAQVSLSWADAKAGIARQAVFGGYWGRKNARTYHRSYRDWLESLGFWALGAGDSEAVADISLLIELWDAFGADVFSREVL